MDFLVDFTSGLIGGVTNCISGHFMDTVKIRMQMDPSMTSISYTLKHIIQKEGFLQLYSGLYYPLLFQTIGFSVVFSVYQFYRRFRNKQIYSTMDGFQNGAIVGIFITFVSTPVQLVKCIMQNDTKNTFKSSPECMRAIFKEKGIRGLYKGNVSLLLRQVIGYSAQFAAYEWIKGLYVSPQRPHLTFVQTLVVGPVSAVIGWIFSYPQDIIKTKLQVQPDGRYKNWKWFKDGGLIDCGKQIYRNQGWRGFCAGLSPCLIRAAYSDGIGIMAYEKARQALSNIKNSQLF